MTREEAIKIMEQRECCMECVVEDFTCKDCDTAFEMAIKALEQQTCEDAISRKATVERLCKVAEFMNEKRDGLGSPYIMAALFIQDNKEEFPSVQPKTTVCEDAVSRKAAIDEVRFGQSYITKLSPDGTLEHLFDAENKALEEAVERIEQLPPVTPEQELHHSATLKQVMWERDVAIDQLKQLGYGLGEKIRTDEDAISRQAVLDINESHHGQMPNHINHQIWQEIKDLPSVNPQPYPDSISRSDMLDAIGHGTTYTSEDLQRIIKTLPLVNPQPKIGHWIYWHTNGFGRKIYKCSKCNWDGDTAGYNFCPDCGAKMIESQESEGNKDEKDTFIFNESDKKY